MKAAGTEAIRTRATRIRFSSFCPVQESGTGGGEVKRERGSDGGGRGGGIHESSILLLSAPPPQRVLTPRAAAGGDRQQTAVCGLKSCLQRGAGGGNGTGRSSIGSRKGLGKEQRGPLVSIECVPLANVRKRSVQLQHLRKGCHEECATSLKGGEELSLLSVRVFQRGLRFTCT